MPPPPPATMEPPQSAAPGPAAWGHQHVLWICVIAMGLHYLEEYALDFVGWLDRGLHLKSTLTDFNWVNAGVLIVAVGCAATGWRSPAIALSLPALLAINAVAFHVPMSFVTGLYCPGTATSLLFFLPAAIHAFRGARRDGVLDRRTLLLSIAGGAFLQVYPFLLAGARS